MTYVNFNSTPTGAEVFIDGKSIGKTQIRNKDLKKGTYNVKMSKDGYADKTDILSISATDLVKTMNFTLVEKSKVKETITAEKEKKKEEKASDLQIATYEEITGEKLRTDQKIISWLTEKLKAVGGFLGMNAVGKLIWGQNLNGEKDEFGSTQDYIDLALFLVTIIPISKVPMIIEKVFAKTGAEGLTKLSLQLEKKGASQSIKDLISSKITGKNIWKAVAVAGAGMGFSFSTEWFAKEGLIEAVTIPLQADLKSLSYEYSEDVFARATTRLESYKTNLDLATKIINAVSWLNPLTRKGWLQYVENQKQDYELKKTELESYRKLSVEETTKNETELAKNEEVEVKVRSIVDGDTLTVLLEGEGKESEIRLAGIDTPEKGATGYKEAGLALQRLVVGENVILKIDQNNAQDKYGRVLAVVMLGNKDINLEMVKTGWANYFNYENQKFVDGVKYQNAQNDAKKKGLGVWGMLGLGEVATDETATETTNETSETATETTETTQTKETISDINVFWEKVKTYYPGRMYLSKKELVDLENKYNFEGTEIKTLLTEMKTFYSGKMYLSKKELADLGAKYNLSLTGLF